MKKLLAMILCVMMLGAVCLAEELPVIQFRGVSLGTTLGEMKAATGERIDAASNTWMPSAIEDIIKGDSVVFLTGAFSLTEDAVMATEEQTAVAFLQDVVWDAAEVAGYSCTTMRYYVRPVQDGVLDMDDDHAMLYAGRYEIYAQMNQVEETVADLTAKLTQLYGTPEVEEKYEDFGFTTVLAESRTTWYGADDTEVVICANPFNSNVIYLSYVWRGAQPLIDTARECIVVETVDNSTNFNGL